MSSLSAMKWNQLCFLFLKKIHEHSVNGKKDSITVEEIMSELNLEGHTAQRVMTYLNQEALVAIQAQQERQLSLTDWGRQALGVQSSSLYHYGDQTRGI